MQVVLFIVRKKNAIQEELQGFISAVLCVAYDFDQDYLLMASLGESIVWTEQAIPARLNV